jgi:hypothetical protein
LSDDHRTARCCKDRAVGMHAPGWHRSCGPHPTGKGVTDARKRNHRASPPGQGRRQGAFDTGGRVCPGGNGARAGGEARGSIHEAGDRDRSFQGAAVGREASGASQGSSFFADSCARIARPSEGKVGETSSEIPEAVAGSFESASARRPLRRLPEIARPPGAHEREETGRRAPFAGRPPGGADTEETLLAGRPVFDAAARFFRASRQSGLFDIPSTGYCVGVSPRGIFEGPMETFSVRPGFPPRSR